MNILGVSGGFHHDASACLIVDGAVVAFCEEERLIRTKRAPRHVPVAATLACLSRGGLELEDVDVVAFGWDGSLDPSTPSLSQLRRRFLEHPALAGLEAGHVMDFGHHRAHAMSGVVAAGVDHAAVIVVDGRGELESSSIYSWSKGRLTSSATLPIHQSIGLMYAAATRFLGFGSGGEGKTMGLAAYGTSREPFPVRPLLADGAFTLPGPDPLALQDLEAWVESAWFGYFESVVGSPRRVRPRLDPADLCFRYADEVETRHKDLASRTQATLELSITELVERAVATTGFADVVLTGGVALNCAANGALRRLGHRVHFCPWAGDCGTSLGAAALAALELGERFNLPCDSPYLGLEWSDAELADCLRRFGVLFTEPADLAGTAADAILRGQVLGWFQGRAEVGPRALGHRSILADARLIDRRDRINGEIKARELWRPLAPIVNRRASATLFETGATPYMLEASRVVSEHVSSIGAACHVDGTSRPQLVSRWTSSAVHDLLDRIDDQTGTGAVLNTSFNIGNEPIVYSPGDAVRAFFGSTLDVLIMGPFLVGKTWR